VCVRTGGAAFTGTACWLLTYLQRRPRARLLPGDPLYHQECSLAALTYYCEDVAQRSITGVERQIRPSPSARNYLLVLDAGGERAAVAYS